MIVRVIICVSMVLSAFEMKSGASVLVLFSRIASRRKINRIAMFRLEITARAYSRSALIN